MAGQGGRVGSRGTAGFEVIFFFYRNYRWSMVAHRSFVGHKILGFCRSEGGLSNGVKHLLIKEV
jgi:hypothetical protein